MLESGFTLTFAVEILNNNDYNEIDNPELIDLGPCSQGMKIQYNLYPGYTYDLDILIWPNVCKIWCGYNYGWVRIWQFLNKYWMTFTIRHKLPVRVEEFRNFEIIITPTVGMASFSTVARNDKSFLILIPPLNSGQLRYFAKVLEKPNENVVQSIMELIWNQVSLFIPATFSDGGFDTPEPVSDIRHQDSILNYVKETVLSVNENLIGDIGEIANQKEKGKKIGTEAESSLYKLKLNGDIILAGSGRTNRFVQVGQCSTLQGQVLAIISTSNLPAPDDLPIMFVNINKLTVGDKKRSKIKIVISFSQIYTHWNVGTTEHDSKPQSLTEETTAQFDDHYTIPIDTSKVHEIFYVLMDNCFEIQLRGIKEFKKTENPAKFFNIEDKVLSVRPLNNDEENLDVVLACTRIDIQELSRGTNKLICGEFSLYPNQTKLPDLKSNCTNYINGIRALEKPDIGLQPYVVLKAQMTIEISVGLLGCEIRVSKNCFSRLLCYINKRVTAHYLLDKIQEMNESILIRPKGENLLTGFSLELGDKIIIFLEGEKNKGIIRFWEIAGSLYPDVETVFSSSDTHLERMYPEMVTSNIPFDVMKMHVSMSTLLACPPVYVHPALPVPARTALLKIGQIVTRKLNKIPSRYEMPTAAELRSFKLELCTPVHIPSTT
ncbi:uncharacterized protein [Battus philenor]|uniref:uncharacterized protein n=1 Tax=Battus philenor TaxID=42288 RepID=UPI0035D036BF